MIDVLGLGDWRDGLPTVDRLGRRVEWRDFLSVDRDEDTGEMRFITSNKHGGIPSIGNVSCPPIVERDGLCYYAEPAKTWGRDEADAPARYRIHVERQAEFRLAGMIMDVFPMHLWERLPSTDWMPLTSRGVSGSIKFLYAKVNAFG